MGTENENAPLTSVSENEDLKRRVLWSMPTVLAVLGTCSSNNEPHLMNVSWVVPVANEPTRLVASVEKGSRSEMNLFANSGFCLSLVAREDRHLGRLFVKPQLTWHREGDDEFVQEQPILRSSRDSPGRAACS